MKTTKQTTRKRTKNEQKRTKPPALSPEQARSFDGYSEANAIQLDIAAAQRGCHCVPYKDFFTLRRWNAQGYSVRKGEHGVKLTAYRPISEKDSASGEEKVIGRAPITYTAFCRCQTEPPKIDKKP